MFSDPCRKVSNAVERVPLSGKQFSLASLDVSERTKAVNLQFVNEIGRSQMIRVGVKAAWDASCVAARMNYSGDCPVLELVPIRMHPHLSH